MIHIVNFLRVNTPTNCTMASTISPPDKFREGANATRFFRKFEIFATAKDWSDDKKKATQVMLLLEDKPFDYAFELPATTKESYTLLKQALLTKYESGDLVDNYIRQFQELRFRRGDDPLMYMSQLRQMGEKAYPGVTGDSFEKLVMSQFQVGLPEDIRRQLHLLPAKPENAADLVDKVKLFTQLDSGLRSCARVEESPSEMSLLCQKIDALSQELAELKGDVNPEIARVTTGRGRGFQGNCFKCRRPGHRSRDCRVVSAGSACFTCGNSGHRQADCALNRKLCRKCGNTGHAEMSCKYVRPLKD